MDLPRLTDVLAEAPRKPNRYSRKARQQRQEHLRSWSLIIGGLVIAFLITLLAIPPTYDEEPSTNAVSASVVPLALGGPRDTAREPNAVDAVAAARRVASADSSDAGAAAPVVKTAALPPLSSDEAKSPRAVVKKRETVEYLTHVVKNGESLSVIARSYRVDWFTLLSVNKLKSSRSIHAGDSLRIPNRKGLLHVVRQDETLEDISLAYDVPMSRIATANDLPDPDVLRVKQELFLPDAKIPRYLTRAGQKNSNARERDDNDSPRTSRARKGKERFQMPSGGFVSSGYGYRTHPISGRWTMHKGVDFAATTGTAISAAKSGVVTFAGPLGGYGKLVVIEHADGYTTRYAHCSRVLVSKGDKVRQGDRIARVGDTGYTTGPHLHFEVWRGGSAVDPAKVLRRK